MSKRKRRDLTADEQHILQHGHLRLLTRPDETARCDPLILEHHHLHSVRLVGEHLRCAFVYRSQWLAPATCSAPASHIKDASQHQLNSLSSGLHRHGAGS